jgi:hypothetical protein
LLVEFLVFPPSKITVGRRYLPSSNAADNPEKPAPIIATSNTIDCSSI